MARNRIYFVIPIITSIRTSLKSLLRKQQKYNQYFLWVVKIWKFLILWNEVSSTPNKLKSYRYASICLNSITYSFFRNKWMVIWLITLLANLFKIQITHMTLWSRIKGESKCGLIHDNIMEVNTRPSLKLITADVYYLNSFPQNRTLKEDQTVKIIFQVVRPKINVSFLKRTKSWDNLSAIESFFWISPLMLTNN